MKTRILLFTFFIVTILGCAKTDLYEKVRSIPGQQWDSKFKPQFKFTISDTTAPHQLYVILRHSEKYNYNNIWLNLFIKGPGDKVATKVPYELQLATNEKGWLAAGMDDIYEHRILLTPTTDRFYFKKAGEYTFTIEQIMRENPLQNVMDVGLRIERKQP